MWAEQIYSDRTFKMGDDEEETEEENGGEENEY